MRRFKNKPKAFKFKPFSTKQRKLLYWWEDGSPYKDYDIVLADGAIRSGKTIAMICSFLRWSQKNFKGEDFIIAGKSIGALKRNVVKPMQQILAAWGWKYQYNRSENFIIIGTNTYYLFGANNEASQDVLQGLTAAGALADEVALFPQSFVEQMIGRCSVEGSKVFMNCNPRGPYHHIKVEYIDKASEKRIYYLHFTMDDNLSLSQKVKEMFRRMFSGVFFKRYILGLWVLAEGIIYDMWDDEKHLFDYTGQEYNEYYVAIDYATSTVMTFGLYGIERHKDGDKVYLVREYYYDAKKKNRQKTDSEFGDDFGTFLDGTRPRTIYVDPSASSFKAELKKRGYMQVKDADNDVVSGIRLVATFLATGRFFVERNCIDTIKEFSSYVWDEKAQERGEDRPIKENDHAMDRNRYFIYTKYKKAGIGVIEKPKGW